jgi:putative addiction module killer protein
MSIYQITVYSTRTKKEPFLEWRNSLGRKEQTIVMARINRMRVGNLGDAKPIKGGGGIWEIRITYGPGYRIYFAKQDNKIIVLLIGGDKGSQDRDIEKAKKYWLDHKEQL